MRVVRSVNHCCEGRVCQSAVMKAFGSTYLDQVRKRMSGGSFRDTPLFENLQLSDLVALARQGRLMPRISRLVTLDSCLGGVVVNICSFFFTFLPQEETNFIMVVTVTNTKALSE